MTKNSPLLNLMHYFVQWMLITCELASTCSGHEPKRSRSCQKEGTRGRRCRRIQAIDGDTEKQNQWRKREDLDMDSSLPVISGVLKHVGDGRSAGHDTKDGGKERFWIAE